MFDSLLRLWKDIQAFRRWRHRTVLVMDVVPPNCSQESRGVFGNPLRYVAENADPKRVMVIEVYRP